MADAYTIELGDTRGQLVPDGDTGWLDGLLAAKPGATQVRIRAAGEDEDDTEGHLVGRRMRVIVETDDDTEGHAVSIHFPTRDEADAFRRRLVLGGVLAGSVALGAAGGLGLSALQSSGTEAIPVNPNAEALAGAAAMEAPVTIQDAQDAAALRGAGNIERPLGMPAGAAATQASDANSDTGLMDASGAAITGAAAVAQPADANADVGIMDASGSAAPESAPDEPADQVVGPR